MYHKFIYISLLLTLTITACDNPKSYTLEELEKNQYNDLNMRVDPAPDAEDFEQIFKEFSAMDSKQILARLSAKDLELHHASFGFYYLANSYVAEGDVDQAIKYHTIAAQQYINPQSLLKLAELYFFRDKNYSTAYQYLHQSLEVTVEITENNRSHPLAKNGREKALHMKEEMDKMPESKDFERSFIREKLKEELPPLLNKYREIYGLGPRDGEAANS